MERNVKNCAKSFYRFIFGNSMLIAISGIGFSMIVADLSHHCDSFNALGHTHSENDGFIYHNNEALKSEAFFDSFSLKCSTICFKVHQQMIMMMTIKIGCNTNRFSFIPISLVKEFDTIHLIHNHHLENG